MRLRTLFSDSWFEDILNTINISEVSGWPDLFGKGLLSWNKKNSVKPIRTLSLFSGCGGLDIGLIDAGYKVVECVEFDKTACLTLVKNVHGTNVVVGDIRNYSPKLRNIDMVIGGPPCQPFSAAGNRLGTNDKRGNLFSEYVRILNIIKPQAFLFENVQGILISNKGADWVNIQDAFKSAGYTLYWRLLNCADYGVPQFRVRLFIVGIRNDVSLTYMFPYPSHGPHSSDNRPYYTSGCAVDSVVSIGPP